LVLTNEETTEGVFNRVACAYLGKSFALLQFGKLSTSDQAEIKSVIKTELIPRMKVVRQITTLEGAIGVFEEAVTQSQSFDLIVVDYLQKINTSRDTPALESWRVSKAFGDYLTHFGTRFVTRVLIFAQLKDKSEGRDFQDRIENDKTFLAHMK